MEWAKLAWKPSVVTTDWHHVSLQRATNLTTSSIKQSSLHKLKISPLQQVMQLPYMASSNSEHTVFRTNHVNMLTPTTRVALQRYKRRCHATSLMPPRACWNLRDYNRGEPHCYCAVAGPFKGQLHWNSPQPNSFLPYSTYHKTEWDMTGSSVICFVNLLKMFKIPPSQTTPHLPINHVNSHEAEVTFQLAGAWSTGQPGVPAQLSWVRFF